MAVFDTNGHYTEAVIDVVAAIPTGSVMTYGDVAWTFGHAGARAVGMVLRNHGSGLPWWRVVRAGGHPPRGLSAEAKAHYEEEGTPLLLADTEDGYRIDLRRAAWSPTESAAEGRPEVLDDLEQATLRHAGRREHPQGGRHVSPE